MSRAKRRRAARAGHTDEVMKRREPDAAERTRTRSVNNRSSSLQHALVGGAFRFEEQIRFFPDHPAVSAQTLRRWRPPERPVRLASDRPIRLRAARTGLMFRLVPSPRGVE